MCACIHANMPDKHAACIDLVLTCFLLFHVAEHSDIDMLPRFGVSKNTVQVPTNTRLVGSTHAKVDVFNGFGRHGCNFLAFQMKSSVAHCYFRLVLSSPGVGAGPAACAAAEMG